MKYPLEKYRFAVKPEHTVVDENGDKREVGRTIIALSTFEGKAVKGYSRCHPNDAERYDEAYGKELAAARCGEKISTKRVKRAEKKLMEAYQNVTEAIQFYHQMIEYVNRSRDELDDAREEVKRLENLF